MKFLDYIRGYRKGKEAHRIERNAMDDPFLAEAIEGYDSIPGNHADRIARMRSAITARSVQRRQQGAWKISIAAVAVIVLISGYFVLLNHQSSMVVANETTNGYIDLYVPQEYVEQKRLELTAIQEENPQREVIATSVATISNLHEVITPIDPIRIYVPESYAQLRKDEIQELSGKQKNINNHSSTEIISTDAPMLASHEEISQKDADMLSADVQNALDSKVAGLAVATPAPAAIPPAPPSPPAAVMAAESIAEKSAPAARSAKAESRASNKKYTLEGKIVDQNHEPLIGVAVQQKGTNNATITDIDGNYKLNVDSDDAALTAYFIGFEKIDIPDPKNTKVVAMKENTQQLDEVVVTGYGVQKKSTVTGASVSVKAEKMKAEPAKIKPEPVAGMKEYKKYIEANIIRPENTDCDKTKGKVVLQFSVGIDGHPTDITVKKSLCKPFDDEAIRLIEEGPKWKAGNTTTEIEIKF